MRKCALALSLLLVSAGLACAQPPAPTPPPMPAPVPVVEPAIVGDALVSEHRIVRYKVTGLGPKDGILWKVRPDAASSMTGAAVIDYGLRGAKDQVDLEFVAPPGKYVVEAVVVRSGADGKWSLASLEKGVEIFARGPTPPNPPVPGPGPGPTPVPAPSSGDPDPVLVAKYQAALAKDVAAKFPGGGSKDAAAALAAVYLTAADMLAGDDKTQWPATVAELYERLAAASAAKMVPKLPVLAAVRDVTGSVVGSAPSDQAIDSTARMSFAAKFKAAGLALQKASQ